MITIERLQRILNKVFGDTESSPESIAQATEKEVPVSVEVPLKVEEKPQLRKLEVPPNCYSDGTIKAHFGNYTYEQIYKYTSRRLEIRDNGGRNMPCSMCSVKREYNLGLIEKNMKAAACGYCHGNFTYLDWANTNALKFRHNLFEKGLLDFVQMRLNLGYDDDKKLLIFPLNKWQYVTLGFDGKNFTESKAESLKILMHYNRTLMTDKGNFKPIDRQINNVMPYLDNRFFGVNGEVVFAECAACTDGGRKLQDEGKIILPFPI